MTYPLKWEPNEYIVACVADADGICYKPEAVNFESTPRQMTDYFVLIILIVTFIIIIKKIKASYNGQ